MSISMTTAYNAILGTLHARAESFQDRNTNILVFLAYTAILVSFAIEYFLELIVRRETRFLLSKLIKGGKPDVSPDHRGKCDRIILSKECWIPNFA